jgi:hypothetical protein
MISDGPKRRDQQLIEGSLFALAGHGQSRQHHRTHHRQRADQAWDHAPARVEVRVVPGAGDDLNARLRLTVVFSPVAR